MIRNKMKYVFLPLAWILGVTITCSAQTTLYFPQVADGLQAGNIGWITVIAITNAAAPGTPAASGTITLTQDNGSAFNVAFYEDTNPELRVGSGNTVPFQVAGGQTKAFSSHGDVPLNSGFATVTSNLPIVGAAAFIEFSGPFIVIGEAGVPAATPLLRQVILVAKNHLTGVAIVNPGASTATVTFQLLDQNGVAAFPVISKTIAGMNHTAFFVGQLFPSVSMGFYGTMRIVSDTPLLATALIFEISGGNFATFPVFPLP